MIVLAWPDCDGNTTMITSWRDDFLVDWCDCFFQCCMFMVEAATGDEPHAPVAHPDSNFCFTSPWDVRTLVFVEMCFEAATGDEPLVPVAHPDSTFCFTSPWDLRTLVFRRNVWHITSMSGNRISIHRTNRKHAQYLVSDQEGFFYAIVHVVINTASTLCSFVCTKSICYVHNSCA